jgi:ribosomal protein S27AE
MVVFRAKECNMIRSKTCFKCKTVKPLEEFYKHDMMADGHVNKCKECNKKDALEHRLKNIDRIREYDKQRAKNPERQKAASEISHAWRMADRRRLQCHNAVSRAIKSGKLVRQPCVRCGNVQSLAHHEDYDKPLDVMWLCQPCHKQRHKEIFNKENK